MGKRESPYDANAIERAAAQSHLVNKIDILKRQIVEAKKKGKLEELPELERILKMRQQELRDNVSGKRIW